MSSFSLVLMAVLAHALAVISPGPDFVVAVRNSLNYSRRIGVWTALGFALGIVVHVSYCIGGIGLIISKSLFWYSVLKYSGGIYLLYIGVKAFWSKEQTFSFDQQTEAHISWHEGMKMGFMTNVLNPKATLFFLSIFNVLLKPDTPMWVVGVSGIWMVVDTFLWFTLVAYLFTQPSIQAKYLQYQAGINKILGIVLIVLGVLVLAS